MEVQPQSSGCALRLETQEHPCCRSSLRAACWRTPPAGGQAFHGSDEAHPLQGAQSALLRPWVKIFISFSNIVPEPSTGLVNPHWGSLGRPSQDTALTITDPSKRPSHVCIDQKTLSVVSRVSVYHRLLTGHELTATAHSCSRSARDRLADAHGLPPSGAPADTPARNGAISNAGIIHGGTVALRGPQKDTCLQDESWNRKTRMVSLPLRWDHARRPLTFVAPPARPENDHGATPGPTGRWPPDFTEQASLSVRVPREEDGSRARCAPVRPWP